MHPEFPLDPSLIYLNHAAVSPWPKRTAEAVQKFAQENIRLGAAHYPRWMVEETRLREQIRTLIHAPAISDIALVKNTSEALSFVAGGLDFKPDDELIVLKKDFPSNRIPWEILTKTRNIKLVEVEILGAEDPEGALLSALTPKTKMMAISSVHYATGLRLDLKRLGAELKAQGVLFLVDAIQSAGALHLDVEAMHIDFAMADGHKWLIAPEGLGFFYVASHIREFLKPIEFGWHMVEQPGDYHQTEWHIAKSARRYECGSPNMLGVHALSASLGLLLEEGREKIEHEVLLRSRYLQERIQAEPELELLSDTRPQRISGIVSFRHRSIENERLFNALKHQNVICAQRGDGIRFSPHYYTELVQLDRAVDIVLRCNES
jgi:selenocysteine lyase/cysteine desulfurase